MAKRRRYTDDFRASAVLMLEAAGYPDEYGSLTAVSKKIEVPPRTLSRWFKKEQNPPPDQLVKEKRGELVERLEDLAHTLIDAIYKDLDENGVDAVKGMTATAIAIDKLQLLRNRPTAIVKLQRALEDGRITPDQVRERWPNLADKLFSEAGVNALD